MNKAFGFAMAATMVIGGTALADVLYHNPVGVGTARDQEYPDFPTYSIYLVADLNVPNPGFTLTRVIEPMTVNGAWGGVNQARLHIFSKTGGLPVGEDDPTASQIVTVSYDVNTGILTTVGLNVDVAAGDYWIGLTPIASFGQFGSAFHLGGVNVNGEIDAYRNPGDTYGFPAGPNWGPLTDWASLVDIALTVEGVPIPPKCPWDLDNNEVVGASDLLSLLASWGPCKGCPADFDDSGTVGASDLLALLANWGLCPQE